MIEQNQNITQKEIASKLKTTVRTIERNVNILKEKEILQRIGTDKVGYWKIKK
ncbi:MAG: HTH domain-containing protein [Clostridia bacterium]|nr:HTH domain-containing protein [Clostridia bacterium]